MTLEVSLSVPFEKHLLRLEISQEFLYVVVGALTCQELTRGDIQEGHTTGRFPEVDGS